MPVGDDQQRRLFSGFEDPLLMRFLTYSESAAWCSKRGYPTRNHEDSIVGAEPNIEPPEFQRVEFPLPKDSGRKIWLARFLYGLVDTSPELLIWLGDWDVWPSSQHMPLFSRFRQSFGESRPVIDAPGHLVMREEADDAISILAVSMLFFWDCHVLTASGRDVLFVSHDEFGWFGSRDISLVASVGRHLEAALGTESSG